MTTVLLLALYTLVVAAAIGAAAFLRRAVSRGVVIVFWVLPLIFVFPGVATNRTILPVDHGMLILPWSTLHPAVRHNANLNDVATHLAPWAKAVRMAWKEGSFPWRQRWNGSGMALAANGQSAAFSPLTFLMFGLPLARAFTLAAAVKLFLAFLGMWLWLVELGVSRPAAIFGSVCFGLSGVMTPWLLFPHTSVACLWPWAFFAAERLCDERVAGRAFFALTVLLLFWALGGHPESALLGGLFFALWVLSRALLRDLERPFRVLRRIALAAAIAAGLSAVLLVPQAIAIARSSRVPVAREFARRLPARVAPHGPLWSYGFVTAVFPRALGDAVGSPMISGGAGSFPEMGLGYFGILGWAVALGVLRPGARRKRSELALLVPLVAGFGVAVMQWPFFEIAVRTPVLGMMFYLRYFSWVALAGSAIAAFELDRLREDAAGRRGSAFVFLALLAALAIYGLWVSRHFQELHAAVGGLASQSKAFAAAWISLGAAAAAFLAARASPRGAGVVLPLAFSAIAAAELLYQGMRLYSFGPSGDLYPDTPMLAFLRSRPGPFRVVGEATVLFPNSSIFAGLEDIRTKDPVERLDYIEFLDATCGYPAAEEFKQIRNVNASALDFLNVRYLLSAPGRSSPGERWSPVYSGKDGTVFENPDVVPRVFAPRRITAIPGSGKPAGPSGNAFTIFGAPAAALAAKRDWRDHAFVLGPAATIENGSAEVGEYRESTNRISFRARVAGAGDAFLVASLVQDGGWSARDASGQWIPTTLANGPFLALRVPAGDHRIRLTYLPPGFWTGALVSTLTLVVLGAVAGRRLLASTPWGGASLELDRAPPPGRWRMSAIWLVGSVAVLVAGLLGSRLPFSEIVRVPVTPLDYTSTRLAGLWQFLYEARDRVPPGASYTVLASHADDEMALYMFSLGILDRRAAFPSSYFGRPQKVGAKARYVLAYGSNLRGTEGLEPIFRTEHGAVYDREPR